MKKRRECKWCQPLNAQYRRICTHLFSKYVLELDTSALCTSFDSLDADILPVATVGVELTASTIFHISFMCYSVSNMSIVSMLQS